MLYIFAAVACILYGIYKYLNRTYDYWSKKNVEFYPPVTFFGNLWESFIFKKSLGDIYTDIYRSFKEPPYVGIFKMRQPGLLIRDPEIVRDILGKDFQSFQKNDIDIDEKLDPVLARNPFFQTGNRWKVTRSQLTQCFTSGKIKLMFPLMIEVSNTMIKYVEQEIKIESGPLEAKELSGKFTTDNVASCAFGLNGKAFEDPNSEFRRAGNEVFKVSFVSAMKFLVGQIFPELTKILRIRFMPEKIANYFENIIKTTLKYRQENNITRNDFLDIMNQLKFKSTEFPYTDDDVTAHALSFFLDGYETSAGALSFTLYEIAANSDVQQKLRLEIEDTLKKFDGVLTYEALQEMSYLECVTAETLRIHPVVTFLTKLTTRDHTLPPNKQTGTQLTIEKGTPIIIPVYGMQRDPKYFPNPDRFDADRFSESNKADVIKGTYLPFGEGPRLCIGMRFAQLQIKVAIVALVKNFDISVNKRTQEPIELDPKFFLSVAKGGIWLDFIKRNDANS